MGHQGSKECQRMHREFVERKEAEEARQFAEQELKRI